MDNKRLKLASHWEELGESCWKICLRGIPFRDVMESTKGWNPTRKFRLLEERKTSIRENQATIQDIEEQLNQTGPTLIPSGSQGEKTRTQRQKQDLFQPKAERVRPNDPEAVGIGEKSKQEPEIVVNTSGVSSPTNSNITPTQTEHNVVTPESNLNSDKLWLKMSQFTVQTHEQLEDFQRLNERFKSNAILQENRIKAIQESYAQLIRSSEETNKRLNQVFGEKHHCKRERDCLDKDINKLFNLYQYMKPKPQGHALDAPYHQEDIKPDSLLGNKARSPSQYQDEYNMFYSGKEALKQLPEASSWPKFSGTGEYDHMELIDYIDGLFIDLPRITDYWITARLDKAFKGHSSIWYTEMKEIHGRRNWPWWKSQIIQTTAMVLGYGKRPCHSKMTSTLWTKIHMSGVLDSSKYLKPLILK
ncbi:hypothetical protein O181_003768 [Austropuccinia psidii MF-1]|uniref:Uncharacterized protein n=1 Tax=Austropuccinia psidii MF-1 TaxID=1389203 RepID=A0A9Q3BFB0_9BASI|nr:hypothetical protein [Austropuccinia psidii MF-1]